MMEVLHRYLLIVLACMAMLAGIQVPNLVDQYEKRVDAHLREAVLAFQPYQALANKYFGGDIGKLLQLHRQNAAQPIRDEGDVIENLIKRKQHLQQAWNDMQAGLPVQIYRLILRGDRDLIRETLAQYTYSVPLTQDALVAGAGAAAIVLALTELLLALVRWLSEAVTFRLRGRFS
jgi:type II secretory pathway pseudopilin PulG